VHYWVDLQSVHKFRCYDNRAPNAKCQRLLVLALFLVLYLLSSTGVTVDIVIDDLPLSFLSPLLLLRLPRPFPYTYTQCEINHVDGLFIAVYNVRCCRCYSGFHGVRCDEKLPGLEQLSIASGVVELRIRADSGSVGHGSNGSTHLDGSRGSWVSICDPLSHDPLTDD